MMGFEERDLHGRNRCCHMNPCRANRNGESVTSMACRVAHHCTRRGCTATHRGWIIITILLLLLLLIIIIINNTHTCYWHYYYHHSSSMIVVIDRLSGSGCHLLQGELEAHLKKEEDDAKVSLRPRPRDIYIYIYNYIYIYIYIVFVY